MRIPEKAIPKFSGLKEKISGDADNKELRQAILDALPEAVEQTKDLAPYFQSTSDRETAKKIFDFLKKRVKYRADDYRQVIQLPSAMLRPGAIADCKSLSLFTGAILQNLGIPWHFVLASYSESTIQGHIYVQTDGGIIIDVVWGKFNSEKKPNYRYKMRYKTTGAGLGAAEPIDGFKDAWQKAKTWVGGKVDQVENFVKETTGDIKDSFEQFQTWTKEKINSVIGKAKTLGLSPGRSLFLIVVKNNLDGMASKLQKIDQGELRSAWNNAGGNWTNLTEAIRKGASRRSINIGLLKGISKIAGINGIGQSKTAEFFQKPEVQAAIVTLCSTVGGIVGSAAGSPSGPGAVLSGAGGTGAGGSMGLVINAMAKILPQLLFLMTAKDKGSPEQIIIDPVTEADFEQGAETNYTPYIIGGVIIAGLAIVYFTQKKK
jgi:hypothetical protein